MKTYYEEEVINYNLGMKITIILATLVAAALANSEDTYNSDFDNFDIEDLVQNIRLLESYGKCFLYRGPCTSYGKEFRKLMPEAIRTSCAKCTPKQRQMIRAVVHTFKTKLPNMWSDLATKEDPKGIYKTSFDNFLNSQD